MLGRSLPFRVRYRRWDNLTVDRVGRSTFGFMPPYRIWEWKQNELFRNIHEAQFEHLRNVYKRQWYEAFRVNADEYIYKYNKTKAAQYSIWEKEMEAQEQKRHEVLQREQGRQDLKSKHLDLLREYYEREFFHWYERASERLQYMSRLQFVAREDLDSYLEKQLNKYVTGKHKSYPLNFVGQMPLLEDSDGNVTQVPAHLIESYKAEFPDAQVTPYDAPRVQEEEGRKPQRLEEISAEIVDLEAETLRASVIKELELEEDQPKDGTDDDQRSVPIAQLRTEEEDEVKRTQYVHRGAFRASRKKWKAGRGAPSSSFLSPEGSTFGSPADPKISRALMPEQRRKSKAELERERKFSKGREKIKIASMAEMLKTSEQMSQPTMKGAALPKGGEEGPRTSVGLLQKESLAKKEKVMEKKKSGGKGDRETV